MDGEPLHIEVDFRARIHSDFPTGWQSAADLMEAFLLVASLELEQRRSLNSRNPFADEVLNYLPDEFRYDPFGSLIYWGPYSDQERRSIAVSPDPGLNYALHAPVAESGEKIGRLPLLGLVWEFADLVLEENHELRQQSESNYYTVLRGLHGVVLGKTASTLFNASFERLWWTFDRTTSTLSPYEGAFLRGEPLPIPGGGSLNPGGGLYPESIWSTAWRLVERRSPTYYLARYGHRRHVVEDILTRGAQLARAGHRNIWPGWTL